MSDQKDPSNPPGRSRVLIAVGIALLIVAFVALHLSGAIGPGSH